MQLAQNIRRIRKEHAMTQEQLAEVLGVTTGAVHKWESGQSVPEVRLLVELARLFEMSVDALLGYGWEKGSMYQAAQKLHQYVKEKRLSEGMAYAEQMLKKYPNSFPVVFHSARIYYLAATQGQSEPQRAVDLLQESIRLFDQNTDETVTLASIENSIAMCYVYQGQREKAIALFKKNNTEGQNECRIGQLLAADPGQTEEALLHLSNALGRSCNEISNICAGYCAAYFIKKDYSRLRQLLQWHYHLTQGLRDLDKVNYRDRFDVACLCLLAFIALEEGQQKAAREHLRKARMLAERFDAAPDYDVSKFYFFHGDHVTQAYDDMGQTAMAIVEKVCKMGKSGEVLKKIWEEVIYEE